MLLGAIVVYDVCVVWRCRCVRLACCYAVVNVSSIATTEQSIASLTRTACVARGLQRVERGLQRVERASLVLMSECVWLTSAVIGADAWSRLRVADFASLRATLCRFALRLGGRENAHLRLSLARVLPLMPRRGFARMCATRCPF